MVSLTQLQTDLQLQNGIERQFRCQANLDLYDSPALQRLATQAAKGRYLRILSVSEEPETKGLEHETPASAAIALEVCLCEDHYPGWLAVRDLALLAGVETPYQPIILAAAEIQTRIPKVIAFAQAAMAQPNQYLWGGTVGPNYDCSGLVQSAFASVGVWIPRDAYQQEAFAQAIALEELLPGDLIFFGPPEKATHVGLYLGSDHYIHSSGKDQGRNGIGIDSLSASGDAISQTYRAQVRGAGRITSIKSLNNSC